MTHELDDYFADLKAQLPKPEEAHDEYLEKTYPKVIPVAKKIHQEQMRNSKRKPAKFNAEKDFERILKIMLDIPDSFDVWLKKDDDLAADEYRRKINNIIWQAALVGTLYLTGRVAGSSKPDPATEKVAMFLINHAMGNPPQRIAVADVSSDVSEHFAEIRRALEESKSEEVRDEQAG